MNTTETKVELVVRAGDEWWFGSDDGKEGVILDASNHNRAIAVGGCDNAEERDRLEFMVKAYNACAGIADPQSAITAARDALKMLLDTYDDGGAANGTWGPDEPIWQKARQALEGLG
jgi:hypothetical protein